MIRIPSYKNGFYSKENGGVPLYPSLWNGLIGHWPMYLGGTGGQLIDHSGFGNNGQFDSLLTQSSWSTYQGEPGLKFSSSDFTGRVTMPNTFKMGGLTTVSCHYRFNEVSNPGAMRSLIRKDLQLTIAQYGTNELNTVLWNPSLSPKGGASFTYDIWNNVVFTWANFVAEHWLNGAKVVSESSGTTGLAADNDSYPLVIGATEAANEKYNGWMQTVTFWNRKLSETEIKILNQNPYAVSYCNPRRYFKSAVAGFKPYLIRQTQKIIG